MLMFLQSCARHRSIRKIVENPRIKGILGALAYGMGGFILSAASLGNRPQPLVMGFLIGTIPGWPAVCMTLGGAGGYLYFWGMAGMQGIVWTVLGLIASGFFLAWSERPLPAVLPPMTAGTLAAVCGAVFLATGKETLSLTAFLLRTVLAAGSTWIFAGAAERRDPVRVWLAMALGVLALAQAAPEGYLGYLAAGAIGAAAPLPAAAMAGIALDLAQVTKVPMTAVLCAGAALRLIPGKWKNRLAPGLAYLPVAVLCSVWDLTPLPGLVAGGILTALSPHSETVRYRRGPVGMLQVRLELTAGALDQSEELIVSAVEPPVDEKALVEEAVRRGCESCPCRQGCQERAKMENFDRGILHEPLITPQDLPVLCRRTGRIWAQLHRAQEQLRSIHAARSKELEYRQAVSQQYRFLAEYLRTLSDDLGTRHNFRHLQFEPKVSAATVSKEKENGDRCTWFAGTCGKYYVLICDGMGTGREAGLEAVRSTKILESLLKAGYSADQALKSLNSLCVLRRESGPVSVDLAELELDTGRGTIYKWGAPPSFLLRKKRIERIGTAVPPPGLSVMEARESRQQLSLRRGEKLVLLSDGAGGEAALSRVGDPGDLTSEALAERVLDYGRETGADDATVAVVELSLPTAGTE